MKYIDYNIFTDLVAFKEKCELENALVTAELQQSAKIVKGEKWMLPFGNEIQTSGLSVDVQLAVQRQLKNKLTNKGVEILKQMGQDVDGMYGNSYFMHTIYAIIFSTFLCRKKSRTLIS